jgi:hypothetical protein
MTIQQMVEIPDSHRLTIEIPWEIPAGRTILTFTPAPTAEKGLPVVEESSLSIEALKRKAAQKAAERLAYIEATGKDPLVELRDSMKRSPFAGIDGVEYQREMRDEWRD